MTFDLTITIGQLLAVCVTLFLALVGAAWALLTLTARQVSARISERMQEMSRTMDSLVSNTRTLERDLLTLKGDLPNHYERRDDAIRREVVIISRLERMAERMLQHGGQS